VESDEAVLNIVRKKNRKNPPKKYLKKNGLQIKRWRQGSTRKGSVDKDR
jgi:hypothetical protein